MYNTCSTIGYSKLHTLRFAQQWRCGCGGPGLEIWGAATGPLSVRGENAGSGGLPVSCMAQSGESPQLNFCVLHARQAECALPQLLDFVPRLLLAHPCILDANISSLDGRSELLSRAPGTYVRQAADNAGRHRGHCLRQEATVSAADGLRSMQCCSRFRRIRGLAAWRQGRSGSPPRKSLGPCGAK
jgi:hypothetical protein